MKKISILQSSITEAMAQIDAITDLPQKNIDCLRLLTEEMFAMVCDLLAVDSLDFEIKQDNNSYLLRATTKTRVSEDAREHLLSVSSDGKNAADKGIKGMLGGIIDLVFSDADPEIYGPSWFYGMHIPGDDYSRVWTLSKYLETVEDTAKNEWDGMGKSIIANFADDVSVGVRSGKLEMTVLKAFK